MVDPNKFHFEKIRKMKKKFLWRNELSHTLFKAGMCVFKQVSWVFCLRFAKFVGQHLALCHFTARRGGYNVICPNMKTFTWNTADPSMAPNSPFCVISVI